MNDTIKKIGNDFVVVKQKQQTLPGTIEEAIEDNHADADEILKSDLFKQRVGKTKYFSSFKTKKAC